ncbi:MAG: hypothetical protein GY846_24705 [Deltaproteobacteria bacterium]|nr:hypothetical protein [Deltaproteobacteria bacterium]
MEIFQKPVMKGHAGLLMFLLIIFVWPTVALSMDNSTEKKDEIFESTLIKDKGDYGVRIDGRQYRVTESTIILDLLGKKIPLCDLPVPCEALVEYRVIEGQNSICLRIEVKRLLEDSKDTS